MITLSPHEITALLLEVVKNKAPTDALQIAKRKLIAEYKRQCGEEPHLERLQHADFLETEDLNDHQQALIEGYFALDPETTLLGYYRGLPVIHAHTAPLRLRGGTAKRNVVAVSRNGAPVSLPRNGWADNFIPAEGVTWAEAAQVIEDWHARNVKKAEA